MHLPHVQPAALGKQASSPPFATSNIFQRASAPVPALSSRHGPATGTALGAATGIGRIKASTPPPSSSSTMVPAAAAQSAFMCFQPRLHGSLNAPAILFLLNHPRPRRRLHLRCPRIVPQTFADTVSEYADATDNAISSAFDPPARQQFHRRLLL
ncbi:hypothetical protein TASIC1_0002063600 [Trichoderma asperellum]|uniref:Uncharacterized protein n=1 Tax=Trichoderma asperellum TaxID=101201 RepID=A0A6V8QMP6_TRIAP|nr:hypothetical protein TASIC1_0002063600 [Trichoderma asperellum]